MLDIQQFDPYTPTDVGEIVGNTDIWKDLAQQIRTNTCPHIVLCGPAGCGKSLFLRLVFRANVPKQVIDCTANAGLRDLRDTIRGFARGSKLGEQFRWIVFEHADSLSADTQAFLRRMMETTANSTRFLFECSDAGAISEPILSRSTLFSISTPTPAEIRYEISRRCGFELTGTEVSVIEKLSGGSVRSALLYAFAVRWNKLQILSDMEEYQEVLKDKPKETDTPRKWIQWATKAEIACRNRGLDYRILLSLGWPNHPDVSYMRLQWSRLGGISTRALFFRAIEAISRGTAEKA